jgi:hypothetical protein
MAKPIDNVEAAALWDQVGVTVDGIRIAPKQHAGGVIFVGYADILVWLFKDQTPIPFLTLSGNSIKWIDGQVHFDPKSEKGKRTRSREYFPHWRPTGGAARAVLTRKLAENAHIQEMVQVAQAQLAEAVPNVVT